MMLDDTMCGPGHQAQQDTRGKVNSMKRELWKFVMGGQPVGEPDRLAIADCRCEKDQILAPKMAEGTATQWASLVICCIQAVANLDPNSQAYHGLLSSLLGLGVNVPEYATRKDLQTILAKLHTQMGLVTCRKCGGIGKGEDGVMCMVCGGRGVV